MPREGTSTFIFLPSHVDGASGRDLRNKSWMSINTWPGIALPCWSENIPICSTDPAIHQYLWKVELVSIGFSPEYREPDVDPAFLFRFPDGPIHVLFDTGKLLHL